jgi:RNA polymerase sigma-70 factor (ECF subfamily)
MPKGNIFLFLMSDEQAMLRVQTQDDHRAFAQLVERWQKPIYRLCARMTGDPHRGEDLKQEAFARLFEYRMDYRPGAKLSTWLWRIALNLCYDELRRRHRRGEGSLNGDEGGNVAASKDYLADEPTPDKHLATREEGELVRRALLRLPEIYRSVLVLRHYEDLKLREIAEVLEIPDGTVNSRLAEGLAQLTRLLEPQFGRQRPKSSKARERPAADARRPSGTCPEPPAAADSARLLSPMAAKTNC